MPQIVSCGKCGKRYKVSDDKAGKQIKCNGCNGIIRIPVTNEVDPWEDPVEEESAPVPSSRLPPPMAGRSAASRSPAKNPKKKETAGGGKGLLIAGVIGVSLVVLGVGGYFAYRHFSASEPSVAKSKTSTNPAAGVTPSPVEPPGRTTAGSAPEQKNTPGKESPMGNPSSGKSGNTVASRLPAKIPEELPPADAKVIDVPSDALFKDLGNNRSVVAARYPNVWVRTEGTLEQIKSLRDHPFTQEGDGWSLMLINDPPPGVDARTTEYLRIPVYFKITDPNVWKKIGIGGRVKIKGMPFEYGKVLGCEVLNYEGETFREVTAEEMARDYSSNVSLAFKKYAEKPFVVSGKVSNLQVLSKDPEADKIPKFWSFRVSVVLKGDGKLDIPIHLQSQGDSKLEGLKIGDDYTAIGKCAILESSKLFPIGLTKACRFSSASPADTPPGNASKPVVEPPPTTTTATTASVPRFDYQQIDEAQRTHGTFGKKVKKTVELRGRVRYYSPGTEKRPGKGMVMGPSKGFIPAVKLTCRMHDDKYPVNEVTPGQIAVIRGVAEMVEKTSYFDEMSDCHIVSVEGPRAPELDLDALPKEYLANASQAIKKLYDKFPEDQQENPDAGFLLRGKVKKVEVDSKDEMVTVTMQSNAKYPLHLYVIGHPITVEIAKQLKPGNSIFASGRAQSDQKSLGFGGVTLLTVGDK